MSSATNDLTCLLDANILAHNGQTKKGKKSTKILAKCAEKSTIASRNNKTEKTESSRLERRINRLEVEMHARFRSLEEKLTKRVENVEKRTSAIEAERIQNSKANSELLMRVHVTAKEETQRVQDALEGLQIAVTKNTSDQDKTSEIITKMKNNRLVTHAFEARLSKIEKRIDFIDTDDVAPAFRYKNSTKPKVYTGLGPASSSSPAPPAMPVPVPVPVQIIDTNELERKVRACERAISASTKLTQEALSDQKAAVLFLYQQSNIVSKARMSSKEVSSIFDGISS